MTVTCRECGAHYADMSAPPVLVATHDEDELPVVLSRHLLTEIQRMHRGFCANCGGPMESTVLPREAGTFSDAWNVRFTCRACGDESWSVVTGAVIDHPAVAGLLHDAGIDILKTPIWEVDAILNATETVASEDPVRIVVTIETDEARLELTVDGDLDVVAYERLEPGG